MNLKKIISESNGRESFSIRIRPEIMEAFKKLCDLHGYSIGKRIEIALINDIRRPNGCRELPPQSHADTVSPAESERPTV